MRNGMALALGVFLGSVALLMPALGNHGLWLALLLFMAARGLWLGACYLRIDRTVGFVAAPVQSGPT
jgi:MATE family multidrug resistance protein